MALKLTLPLDREILKTLKAGQACMLTGPLFTLRDAGHQRLLEEMGDLVSGNIDLDTAVERMQSRLNLYLMEQVK